MTINAWVYVFQKQSTSLSKSFRVQEMEFQFLILIACNFAHTFIASKILTSCLRYSWSKIKSPDVVG